MMTSNDTVKLGIKRFTAKPEIKHQIVYSENMEYLLKMKYCMSVHL